MTFGPNRVAHHPDLSVYARGYSIIIMSKPVNEVVDQNQLVAYKITCLAGIAACPRQLMRTRSRVEAVLPAVEWPLLPLRHIVKLTG